MRFLNIKEMLAPKESKCRSGRRLKGFVGVTIHNTGNKGKGADALSHAKYLQGSGKDQFASWHYCVDEKNITQSIPENEVAWHAADGNGSGNMKTIAIEICMNSDGDILKATNNAAELAADILKRRGIKKADNFLHQHNRWSGKNCPQMIKQGVPYSWEEFIAKVNEFLKEGEEEMAQRYNKVSELPKGLQKEAQELVDSGALVGENGKLDVTEDMVRTMIVNKRYNDNFLKRLIEAIKGGK